MLNPDDLNREPAPADIVPARAIDLSAYEPGDVVGDVLIPGDILTDADGLPLAMTPNEHMKGATVTETGGVAGWMD